MKVIFHIGMGKTGTSSIQAALRTQQDSLAAQKAAYLGMWFTMIDPAFEGHGGMREFSRASAEEMHGYAERFAAFVSERALQNGAELFVFSNESLHGAVLALTEFFQRLRQICDIQFVVYVRRPQEWLPSAYEQWGIRHKAEPGPIQPFRDLSRSLIKKYDQLPRWHRAFGDILTIRNYEAEIDVVQDFVETIGLERASPSKRILERGDPVEVLLRALFNDRFAEPVLPERFTRMILDPDKITPRSVDEMIERCFAMDGIDEIVESNRATFEYLRDELDLDFLSGPATVPRMIDREALQRRLVDYLVELVLEHGLRLKRLERELRELREDETQ